MKDRPTTLDVDGDLDQMLRSAGSRWRATRMPSHTDVDASLFDDHRRSAWVPVLTSVVGLLVLLMAGAFIVASLPTVTSSPTPSATPSRTATLDGIVWTQYDGLRRDFLTWVGVQAVDGQFLATGARCDPATDIFARCSDGNRRFVVAQSSDGTTWTLVAQLDMSQADGATSVTFLRGDRFGWLAGAGHDYTGPGAGLWRSSDGSNWESLGGQPAFRPSECGTASSTVTFNLLRTVESGVVANGTIHCGESVIEAAWRSADGGHWDRLNDPLPVTSFIHAHGTWVGSSGGAIWRSQDGLQWVQTTETEYPVSIAAVESGFVALGSNPLVPNHLILTSPDGVAWSRNEDALLTHNVFGGLSSDGRRGVALESESDDAVWITSPNGAQWTRYRTPGESFPFAAAILGDRVVVIGLGGIFWRADIPE